MVISDYKNSGKSQLYLRTDKGYECMDIYEDLEETGSQTFHSKPQETSVVYTFCTNKLQVKYYMIIRYFYHNVLFK